MSGIQEHTSGDETYRPYFAFGSNLSQADLERVVGEVKFVGSAKLVGYRLAFSRRSERRACGVADVVPVEGFAVLGVLYLLEASAWAALDKREGVAVGAYRRRVVSVLAEGNRSVEAVTYEVVDKEPQEVPPSRAYMNLLLDGARQHELDVHYRNFLRWLRDSVGDGTFGVGLFVHSTESPRQTRGEAVAQLHPEDAVHRQGRSHVVVTVGRNNAPVEQTLDVRVPRGQIHLDQSVREALGIRYTEHYGYRARVGEVNGRWPSWVGLQPRRLHLQVWYPSWIDSEKNMCVMHPAHMAMLGVEPGEYVCVTVASSMPDGRSVLSTVTLRSGIGTGTTVRRRRGQVEYPRLGEIYLDKEARLALEDVPIRSVAVVTASLGKLLAARLWLYGSSFFVAVLSLLPIFDRLLGEGLVSLAVTILVGLSSAVALSYVDLRSRVQY